MSGSIHDLPEEERPREKMWRLGPSALGNDELMAIFLRVGVKGESAIAVGRRLLDAHGGLAGLARMEPKLLAKEHGLGLAKACQLAAAFELGQRLARQTVDRLPLDNPGEIYRVMGPQMAHLRTESLRVLVLNSRLHCIAVEEVSSGSSNETMSYVRDILRPVLLHQATCFVLVHNHPSGDPAPSRADIHVTKEVEKAAQLFDIQLADHVIIGQPSNHHEAYASFRELGLL
ncbi:MAG: DNA repair protein RadC [Verrucomicrobiota bacterium JB023]|nr:DNA repair protein RadC [Verrucomicrobiota bacterium JB023]